MKRLPADPFAEVRKATDQHRARHGCHAYPYQHGPLLGVLAAAVQARRILELGTALGYTALSFAHGTANSMVDSIERDPQHVELAREKGVLLAVRGGGHNGPGLGTCDGGLVVDLRSLKGIRVDQKNRTVRVEGGALWGEVDHATHPFGLAVPSGFLSTTGVGGLTLGGGIGYLSRRYGLTIDNLLEVDVVLADGRLVTASAEENEDLFWAVRGGGGNFGVVTSFLFRANPVATVYGYDSYYLNVMAGPKRVWKFHNAREHEWLLK